MTHEFTFASMKEGKEYRHIFFDLDETLWDFKRNSMETLHELSIKYQFNERGIEGGKFFERYHHHNNRYWDLYRKGKISREELRIIRWQTTLSEFDIDDSTFARNLSENYLQLLPNKKNLYEEALDLLIYLKPKYSLHIITNGFEEVQLRKIEMSGIASYFTHVITSERAGSQKPKREIFLYAFSLTSATVNNSIFIGDSIEADINGAKAIGMDYVLFNPEKISHKEEIEQEICRLSELRQWL